MTRKITIQDKKEHLFPGLRECIMLAVLLCVMCIMPAHTQAEPDWQVNLKVQSGTAYNNLSIGADSTATDGYDPLWDTYALMGGNVEAYLYHPEWGLVHQEFHRDIMAHNPGAVIELPLIVNSTLMNEAFTISWDISSLPLENPIILIDDTTSQQIDMRSAGSYNFTFTGTRSFRINVTENSDCANLPVRIARSTSAHFSSLQDAYNAANDEEIIESRGASLIGNLDINQNKSVTFTGGYNCSYSSSSGTTTLKGSLTISNGSVSIENIIIE